MFLNTLVKACLAGVVLFALNWSDPTTNSASAQEPIKEVKKLKVIWKAFDKKRDTKRPILVKNKKAATKYLEKASLEKLLPKVNFDEQRVLIFAWQGSGQDKLTYTIAESYPEQIKFTRKPGMTKDLRRHVKVYVIRSNVIFSPSAAK